MSDKIRLIYNKIENRIDEICDDGFVLKENQQEYETLTDLEDFIDSLSEEPASGDLEEAMERSVSEEPILEFFATGQPTIDAYGEDSFRNQFKAGVEWQRNQIKELLQTEYEKGRFDKQQEMMKDSFFGVVSKRLGRAWIDTEEDFDNWLLKFDDLTKVKIIIIKQD